MRLILDKNKLNMSCEQFLRKVGYGHIRDRNTGKDSFVRRLGSGFYPRLHVYVDENNNQTIINLHLDQKQASYAGSNAHSGEYDGEVVEKEIKRLNDFLSHNADNGAQNNNESGVGDIIDNVKGDRGYKNTELKKKKSWWKRLFM